MLLSDAKCGWGAIKCVRNSQQSRRLHGKQQKQTGRMNNSGNMTFVWKLEQPNGMSYEADKKLHLTKIKG